MTPSELERSITSAYGADAIDLSADGSTVTVAFRGGESAVYAKRAVRELVAHADNWTPTDADASQNVWTFTRSRG